MNKQMTFSVPGKSSDDLPSGTAGLRVSNSDTGAWPLFTS